MMLSGLRNLLTLFLLGYFISFAVLPVSAVFPSNTALAEKDKDVVSEHNTQSELLLFDIALWQGLKQTKRSDDNIDLIFTGRRTKEDSRNCKNIVCDGLAAHLIHLSICSGTSELFMFSHQIQFTFVYHMYSGVSPPFHS